MLLTRKQREALKAVFDRQPVYEQFTRNRLTYRQFRRLVKPEIGGFGAAMVPWCGMWLGIEKDGHTHS